MRKFIEIKKDQFEEFPESSILRVEEYAIILDAEKVVENAKKQAQEIIAKAESAAQSVTDDARAKGIDEAKKEMSDITLNTLNLCQKFLSNSSIYLHQAVTETVKQIISNYDKHEMTLHMINSSLSKHRCTKVLLKINPNSFEFVSKKLVEIKMLHPTLLEIKISKDSSIDDIGCILETDIGNIQSTLEAQLQSLNDIYLLPINPAVIQAVVDKAPEKLKQAQQYIQEQQAKHKGQEGSIEKVEESELSEERANVEQENTEQDIVESAAQSPIVDPADDTETVAAIVDETPHDVAETPELKADADSAVVEDKPKAKRKTAAKKAEAVKPATKDQQEDNTSSDQADNTSSDAE